METLSGHHGADVLVASERQDSVVLSRVSRAGVTRVADVPLGGGFFVTVHPWLPVAYLTSEDDGGSVVSVDLTDGDVHRVSGVGALPCHLLVTPEGDQVVSANWNGGSVTAIALQEGHVASLMRTVTLPAPTGGDPQARSQPHTTRVAAGGLLVTDMGADTILRLRRDLSVDRVELTCTVGSGPRHLAADPAGDLWVSLELSSQVGRVVDGSVHLGPATAVAHEPRNYPGDIVAAGPWVVMANRGADTLSWYDTRVPGQQIAHEVPCGGRWPAQLAVLHDTVAVACRESGSISFFPFGDDGPGSPVVVQCERPIAVTTC